MFNLNKMLVEHEGLRLKPYKCSAGKLTIGVGRNIDDIGITEDEAMTLLHNDVVRVDKELIKSNAIHDLSKLNEIRYGVILDMIFNLGISRFLQFKKMIKAVNEGDYAKAAIEMKDSKWYNDVGNRAERLSRMMKDGEYVDKWW